MPCAEGAKVSSNAAATEVSTERKAARVARFPCTNRTETGGLSKAATGTASLMPRPGSAIITLVTSKSTPYGSIAIHTMSACSGWEPSALGSNHRCDPTSTAATTAGDSARRRGTGSPPSLSRMPGVPSPVIVLEVQEVRPDEQVEEEGVALVQAWTERKEERERQVAEQGRYCREPGA